MFLVYLSLFLFFQDMVTSCPPFTLCSFRLSRYTEKFPCNLTGVSWPVALCFHERSLICPSAAGLLNRLFNEYRCCGSALPIRGDMINTAGKLHLIVFCQQCARRWEEHSPIRPNHVTSISYILSRFDKLKGIVGVWWKRATRKKKMYIFHIICNLQSCTLEKAV